MITKPFTTTMKDNEVPHQFTITRRQIEKLYKMTTSFQEVEYFTLEESHTNGIGPSVVVKFKVFTEKEVDTDALVDITDYKTW